MKQKFSGAFIFPRLKNIVTLTLLSGLVMALSACGGSGGGSDSSSSAASNSSESSLSSMSNSSLSSSGAISSSSAVSSSLARLRLDGQHIVDPVGQTIMLRGWNWGRWGLVQPNDARDNAEQGANVVRIPLRWWGYYLGDNIDSRDDSQTDTAGIDEDHLAILDSTIAQASAAHLWIILFIDSDCGQNGTQDIDEMKYCDPDGKYANGHNFWTDPDARKKFIDVWKFIAARYKDTPYLGMFEPLPEPNPVSAAEHDIIDFYDEVMTAIRTVAPGIPFIIGPRSYQMSRAGNTYNSTWTDVIYTGNLFVHTGGGQAQNIDDLGTRLQHLTDLRENYNVPIFVQQAGVESGVDPDRTYLDALLSLLTTRSVGYTYWAYRDTYNPDAYGIIYQDGHGGWVTKTGFLDTISSYFKK